MALVRMKKLLETELATAPLEEPWRIYVAMLAAVTRRDRNARLDAPALVVLPIAGMALHDYLSPAGVDVDC